MGILGNEKRNAAAKSALSLPVTRMKPPATGMYPCITKLIFDEWQEVWDCCTGNKLHAIRSTVGYCKQKTCLSRRDTVLLNRLRIGHTRLTHSYLLSGDYLPECGAIRPSCADVLKKLHTHSLVLHCDRSNVSVNNEAGERYHLLNDRNKPTNN